MCRGVVPQQVVGPASRLAERVDVRAAQEVGLHVELLQIQLAAPDPVVHPAVRRVEPAGVADHAHQPRLLGDPGDEFGIGPGVGERNLDLHVLARP